MSPRETWIDSFRGMLILLVVAGHAIGGGIHLMPDGAFSQTMAEYSFKCIYSFHMPAFFFVSGVTFGLGKHRPFRDFLRRKARRLVVPYLIFGVLSGSLYLALSGVFNSVVANHATDTYYADKSAIAWWVPFVGLLHGGGWPNGQGFIANSVLWFLPCLFMVEIAYFILDRALPFRTPQLVFAVLLLLAVYPLGRLLPEGMPWGLSRLTYFLPFFIFGRWTPAKLCPERASSITGAILLLVLIAGVIATPNAWYANKSWGWSLVFIGLALAGTMAFFFLKHLLDLRLMRVCGIASMTIMLLHKFLVVLLELKVPFFRDMIASGGWQMAGATFAVVAISTLSCLIADRLIQRYAPLILGK